MITTLVFYVFLFSVVTSTHLCGDSIRWSHNVNIEYVYGMWYGVGYAQHSPDMTNMPKEIGCVTLYITGADDFRQDFREFSTPRPNYSYDHYRSHRNNPWQDTSIYGSSLDSQYRWKRRAKRYVYTKKENLSPRIATASLNRAKRRQKRDMYGDRRLLVVWDEDGQSVEQTYVYSRDVPGLWTVEKWRPMEREMMSYGVDMWYPFDPPRHPEVIRILQVTPDQLIINHCSDAGGGGIFTMILRRSPKRVGYWEWWELQKQFYEYELPSIVRKAAVCAANWPVFSGVVLLVCSIVWKLL